MVELTVSGAACPPVDRGDPQMVPKSTHKVKPVFRRWDRVAEPGEVTAPCWQTREVKTMNRTQLLPPAPTGLNKCQVFFLQYSFHAFCFTAFNISTGDWNHANRTAVQMKKLLIDFLKPHIYQEQIPQITVRQRRKANKVKIVSSLDHYARSA